MLLDFLIKAAEDPIAAEEFAEKAPTAIPIMKALGIIPELKNQARWDYQLGGDEKRKVLRLAGPDTSLTFGMAPELEGSAEQLPDETQLGESAQGGSAQIHRSGPGMLYFTMQDGRANRTVLLKKTEDGTWVAKVKPQKFSVKAARIMPPWNDPYQDARDAAEAQQAEMEAQARERERIKDTPEFQTGQLAGQVISSKPMKWFGGLLRTSAPASAAVGGLAGLLTGAPAGALLSQLGYEKRVDPADNAVRLGGLGAAGGALLAALASRGIQDWSSSLSDQSKMASTMLMTTPEFKGFISKMREKMAVKTGIGTQEGFSGNIDDYKLDSVPVPKARAPAAA